eukprot:g11069.t1
MTSNQIASIYILYIVKESEPLYELDLSTSGRRDDSPHLDQFIAAASLDELDQSLATSSSSSSSSYASSTQNFFKTVDTFNDFVVSAFVTPGGLKFLLLHRRNSGDDLLKSFLQDTAELFVTCVLVNPFYTPFTRVPPVLQGLLDARVQKLGRRLY